MCRVHKTKEKNEKNYPQCHLLLFYIIILSLQTYRYVFISIYSWELGAGEMAQQLWACAVRPWLFCCSDWLHLIGSQCLFWALWALTSTPPQHPQARVYACTHTQIKNQNKSLKKFGFYWTDNFITYLYIVSLWPLLKRLKVNLHPSFPFSWPLTTKS